MTWRSFGKDTEVPLSRCAGCGAPNTGAAPDHGLDVSPKPGHISICFYCGHYSVFDENLKLRAPTEAEMLEIISDPEVLDMQRRRKRELALDQALFELLHGTGTKIQRPRKK
jgi:hypothetical protein